MSANDISPVVNTWEGLHTMLTVSSGSKLGSGFLMDVFHARSIPTMFLLKLKNIPYVAKFVRIIYVFIIPLHSEGLLGPHDLNWKSLDATSRHPASPFRKLK